MPTVSPRLVVISGALHPAGRTNRLAAWYGRQARDRGAISTVFTGVDLEFPFYRPGLAAREDVGRFLAALAGADGVILMSPAYHGAPTGLLKNALDYVNELGGDARPYLDGRVIGCVALSDGPQGAMSTVACLRAIAHALRGWPTPRGVTLDGKASEVLPDGTPGSEWARNALSTMLAQVLAVAGNGTLPHSGSLMEVG